MYLKYFRLARLSETSIQTFYEEQALIIKLSFYDLGGIFSVALSVGSHLPGITWRFALRSPDFPLRYHSGCLANSEVTAYSYVTSLATYRLIFPQRRHPLG